MNMEDLPRLLNDRSLSYVCMKGNDGLEIVRTEDSYPFTPTNEYKTTDFVDAAGVQNILGTDKR